jgi:hypothetical protein
MEDSSQEIVEQNIVAPDVDEVAPAPRMFSASEVNELVRERVNQTKEKMRREAPSMGGMRQMSEEDIARIATERTQQILQEKFDEAETQQQNARMQQLAYDFLSRIDAGKEQYPELKNNINEINFASIPEIVHLANGVDNTAAVMNELLQHPGKIADLITLWKAQPALAQKEMQKLSTSLRTNENATTRSANEPIPQITPTHARDSGEKMSVREYKKADWLRT